jgi:predicted deacylase
MKNFTIGTFSISAGSQQTVDLPISVLANRTPISLPVHVIHGSREGPVFFISGVVHGDEILGVEIIRRVVGHHALKDLAGTLLAVPIVNTFGFLNHSRYMPDRRDLNRSFPGSDRGSLASLLADLFMKEVVLRAQYGIDLHTAALHRSNLPQIRIGPEQQELLSLAKKFAAPVVLISKLRDGTLRSCAKDKGVNVLLYEAGEALRFDETSIATGVNGILNVMASLKMISHRPPAAKPSTISKSSTWLRAPEGGILRSEIKLGAYVKKGEKIGEISSPLGEASAAIISEDDGIVVGRTNLPVVNRGDALFHLARMKKSTLAQKPLFDEDEII